MRRVLATLLTVLAAVSLLTGLAVPAQAATAADPFFTPPAIPAGARPGDVLRSRQVKYQPINPFRRSGKAWQILYVTTNARGALIATSGLVIAPNRRATGSPLVGVAHGTTGMAEQCAPSIALNNGGDAGAAVMQTFLDDAVDRGWVVAAPDYNGLGTPGDHTYTVTPEQGRATLDAVRAAQRLSAAAVPATAKVAIMGYSQGGQSAAAAAEYAPTYAPELKLAGVAAGGVPADMVAVGQSLDGGPGFGFLMMAALGYDTAYPELGLRSYLNDAGRAAETTVQNSCIGDLLVKFAGKHIADYTTTNPLQVPAIRARFAADSLGKTPPAVPVMLYHGLSDEFLPYAQDQALRKAWCAEGATVHWQDFVGEHVSTALAGQTDALNYVADRLAGKKATTNC